MRLITQLTRKAGHINLIVSKLNELRYPSNNPQLLARLIATITESVRDEILSRFQTSPTAGSDDFEDQVKFAVNLLHILTEDLRFVERAVTQNTPWSLVCPLEKIAEQLHPNSHFVVRPQWSYNYSLREKVSAYRGYLEKLLPSDKLERVFKSDTGEPILSLYIMGFPYIDRLNVLSHVLFGHELGHPIEKEYFTQEQANQFFPPLFDAVVKECKVPPDQQKWNLFDLERVSRMLQQVLELRRRALAELLCDVVAANIFGLAALFATEEFALSRELDAFEKAPAYHYPPWRYRPRVMFEEFPLDWIDHFITGGRFSDSVSQVLKTKLTEIRLTVEQDEDKTNLSKDSETRIAYESVEATLPKIRTFVKERLSDRGFALEDLIGSTNGLLLGRLENWIPPDAYVDENGDEVPADMRAVLNIGWLRWIIAFAQMPAALSDKREVDDYLKKVEALNRLVLKGIEYIDLRSDWFAHSVKEDKVGNTH